MPINFELNTPFMYSAGKGGTEVECNFIELREPTGKVSHTACAIEGLIQSGIMSMAKTLDEATLAGAVAEAKDAPPADDEKDGDAVLGMIVASGVDMSKLVLHFRELFTHTALMGGEKPLTQSRMDAMSHKDLRRMIGVYAANFILN